MKSKNIQKFSEKSLSVEVMSIMSFHRNIKLPIVTSGYNTPNAFSTFNPFKIWYF